MTRRMKIVTIVVITILLLLIRPEILGGLFALIFLGMVPGTNYSVPSWIMFTSYAISIVLVIWWLSRQPMYIGNLSRQEKTARTLARKKVMSKSKKKSKSSAVKRTRARRPAQA